jgi:hypothetical protein
MESFEAFLADVGKRPSASHSIDRFPDPDGNYEPGNVRWATKSEQSTNTSNVWLRDVDGNKISVAQMARWLAIQPWRLYQHFNGERAK